jgi:hypothetical protein
MEPEEFEGSNTIYGQDQPEYKPLPAHRTPEGLVTCCWRLSPEELETVKYTGVVWVQLHTFNKQLQPVNVQVERPELT